MPGPDLRELVGDIREAVERFPRDALIEILTYVFKEYVVQGPAPLAAVAAPLHDGLEGMSFAEVVRSLQLRLDLPELELFDVQGSSVFVRVGGRPILIEAQVARPAPMPAPPPLASPSAPVLAPALPPAPRLVPGGSPGVSFTRSEQTLAAQPPRPAPEARATDGSSSAASDARTSPAGAQPSSAPAGQAEARPAAATSKAAASANSSSGSRPTESAPEPRKGLLEID